MRRSLGKVGVEDRARCPPPPIRAPSPGRFDSPPDQRRRAHGHPGRRRCRRMPIEPASYISAKYRYIGGKFVLNRLRIAIELI